jgi:hypothetical protein
MELKIDDLDCLNEITPIRVINPIISLRVSKEEAFNLIKIPNNLLTFEWYSPIKHHFIIGMILDSRTKHNREIINERCNNFNLKYDVNSRYFLFLNNGLMNDKIHDAVYNRDINKVIKLRIFKILKIEN